MPPEIREAVLVTRLRSKCLMLGFAQLVIGGVVFLVGVGARDPMNGILGLVVLGSAASNFSEWHTLGQAQKHPDNGA